jgi:hypothetical protein
MCTTKIKNFQIVEQQVNTTQKVYNLDQNPTLQQAKRIVKIEAYDSSLVTVTSDGNTPISTADLKKASFVITDDTQKQPVQNIPLSILRPSDVNNNYPQIVPELNLDNKPNITKCQVVFGTAPSAANYILLGVYFED